MQAVLLLLLLINLWSLPTVNANIISALAHTICQTAAAVNDILLQTYYGRKDPDAVAKVKEVYKQLDIAAQFAAYENESYSKLSSTIEEQALLPKEVFTSLLKKIYKRSK